MTGDAKSKSEPAGARRKPIKVAIRINWRYEQDASVEVLKMAVIDEVGYREEDTQQVHLMTDASKNTQGSVLFQLPGLPPGTTFTMSMRSKMKIIILTNCDPAKLFSHV